MRRALLVFTAAAVAALATAPAALAGTTPTPFGNPCAAQDGVRFCPATTLAQRVPSWDGTPIDADVTLPATGRGPWPTIVMLHGYGNTKTDFERGGDYSNTGFARRGYAVVNLSARGFGRSCGQPGGVDYRTSPGCSRGWVHLGDQRYEARDVQTLLGRLVDQGIAAPRALGATGVSYGGGQSMELAFLRDRIRLPDGRFAPWRSPRGTPLRIAAAWPRWPWSDLVSALTPNGRFLDFRPFGARDSRAPVGVSIASYIDGLYIAGNLAGYYAGPGVDPGADLGTWRQLTSAGEPYTAAAKRALDEIYRFHGAYSIGRRPAPLLIEQGWTDDLFPSTEGVKVYNYVRGLRRHDFVSLQLGDLGHNRGSNKAQTAAFDARRGIAFLDRVLRGRRGGPRDGEVSAGLQTCPKLAPAGTPFVARSWAALHPGAVRLGARVAQTIDSAGGDPAVAKVFDPITGTSDTGATDACATVPDEREPGAAVAQTRSRGFTLLGRPTVRAQIRTSGRYGEIAARLWDVSGGKRLLVARAVYRLRDNQRGTLLFQLNGNGYRFPAGHVARVELLGSDARYFRKSNGSFTVRVTKLAVELPTRERPGARGVVRPVLAR